MAELYTACETLVGVRDAVFFLFLLREGAAACGVGEALTVGGAAEGLALGAVHGVEGGGGAGGFAALEEGGAGFVCVGGVFFVVVSSRVLCFCSGGGGFALVGGGLGRFGTLLC